MVRTSYGFILREDNQQPVLADVIAKHTDTLDQLHSIVQIPAIVKVSFDLVYLGEVPDDILHIAIREKEAKLGWLYSKARVVTFKKEGAVFQCELEVLKEMSEGLLSNKTWIPEGVDPVANVLRKNKDGSIDAWIPVYDVLTISQAI